MHLGGLRPRGGIMIDAVAPAKGDIRPTRPWPSATGVGSAMEND